MAVDGDGFVECDDPVFEIRPQLQRVCAAGERDLGADERQRRLCRRGDPAEFPDEDRGAQAVGYEGRQFPVVCEGRIAVAGAVGLCDPQLHAMQIAAVGVHRLLGVHDAASGGHEVQLAGSNELLRAEAVLVQHRALE